MTNSKLLCLFLHFVQQRWRRLHMNNKVDDDEEHFAYKLGKVHLIFILSFWKLSFRFMYTQSGDEWAVSFFSLAGHT